MTGFTELHSFNQDPASGAGNCVCGWPKHSITHDHKFRAAHFNTEYCVCGSRKDHYRHIIEGAVK